MPLSAAAAGAAVDDDDDNDDRTTAVGEAEEVEVVEAKDRKRARRGAKATEWRDDVISTAVDAMIEGNLMLNDASYMGNTLGNL